MKYAAKVILLAFQGSPVPRALLEVEGRNPIDALNEVWRKTQNIDDSWVNNPEVVEVFAPGVEIPAIPRPDGLRSLCVGDRIDLVEVGTYEVGRVGFFLV